MNIRKITEAANQVSELNDINVTEAVSLKDMGFKKWDYIVPSFRIGRLEGVSADQLTKLFGPPKKGSGDGKSTMEWGFQNRQGLIFTVYDYRNPPSSKSAPHNWSIGGVNKAHGASVQRAFKMMGVPGKMIKEETDPFMVGQTFSEWRNAGMEEVEVTEQFKAGDKVKVPHKGKMVSGKIVRYDGGGTGKARQHGGGYVVDVGEPASVTVPKEKVRKEEVEIEENYKDTLKGVRNIKVVKPVDFAKNLTVGSTWTLMYDTSYMGDPMYRLYNANAPSGKKMSGRISGKKIAKALEGGMLVKESMEVEGEDLQENKIKFSRILQGVKDTKGPFTIVVMKPTGQGALMQKKVSSRDAIPAYINQMLKTDLKGKAWKAIAIEGSSGGVLNVLFPKDVTKAESVEEETDLHEIAPFTTGDLATLAAVTLPFAIGGLYATGMLGNAVQKMTDATKKKLKVFANKIKSGKTLTSTEKAEVKKQLPFSGLPSFKTPVRREGVEEMDEGFAQPTQKELQKSIKWLEGLLKDPAKMKKSGLDLQDVKDNLRAAKDFLDFGKKHGSKVNKESVEEETEEISESVAAVVGGALSTLLAGGFSFAALNFLFDNAFTPSEIKREWGIFMRRWKDKSAGGKMSGDQGDAMAKEMRALIAKLPKKNQSYLSGIVTRMQNSLKPNKDGKVDKEAAGKFLRVAKEKIAKTKMEGVEVDEASWGGGFQSSREAQAGVQASAKADAKRERMVLFSSIRAVMMGKMSKAEFKKKIGQSFEKISPLAKQKAMKQKGIKESVEIDENTYTTHLGSKVTMIPGSGKRSQTAQIKFTKPKKDPKQIAMEIRREAKALGVEVSADNRSIMARKTFKAGDRNEFWRAHAACYKVIRMVKFTKDYNSWGCSGIGLLDCIQKGEVILHASGGGASRILTQIK